MKLLGRPVRPAGPWAHLQTSREQLTLVAFRLGWTLVRRMPERLAYAVFDRVADVGYRRGGKGVRRLRANYAKVRPELADASLDALVREGMRAYLRYWCEAFRLPELTRADIAARVRTVGDAQLRAELAAGRPVVAFLGHLGNWDLGGAWSATNLAPVTTVAERLRPEELFLQFLAYRERLGIRILPLGAGPGAGPAAGIGGGQVFRALLDALRAGEFVALLADRDLTQGGVEVDLCGHRARFAAGPAALALTAGAMLVPVVVGHERRPRGAGGPPYGIVVTFCDAVAAPERGTVREKVQAMTQQCADALGAAIVAHTADWHMMQRVFSEDLR
ncbi:MAG TPA: phosphatidylinositol mannoside acyltransferase [Dermatophilaceae bacterium]|nr:phosphatidylinositol mannoside acyltransferase [Dermatophilaceae bacterium]